MNKSPDWIKPSTQILRDAPPLSDTPDVSKPKRARRQLEYKSIVRTRSQKLKEALLYHDIKLVELATFYKANKREPYIGSDSLSEIELATYIHNIRVLPMNTEFVAKVNKALPWFQWSIMPTTRDDYMAYAGMLLFAYAVMCSLYVGVMQYMDFYHIASFQELGLVIQKSILA